MILIQVINFLEYNIFKYKSKIEYFKFIKAKYWIINELNKIIILKQIIKIE